MPREKSIRTLYNPAVGCQYLIKNLETGNIETASTLTIRDVEQKPWRSPKGTPAGEEFFKMKMGKKKTGFTYIKFINSSLCDKCISEDGKWEFLAETPSGKKLPRLSHVKVSSKTVSSKNNAKKKVKNTKKEEPAIEIREDIFDNEFVDVDSISDILSD